MKTFFQANQTGVGSGLGTITARLSLLMFSLFCLVANLAVAQSNQFETQQGLANAIAAYDANIRGAMLQASQYPQVLTDLQRVRDDSRSAFENLISGFPQKKQGWFYELTRYPDLMHSLAQSPGGLSQDAVERMVPGNDENLHEAAWKLYRHHHDDLVQADTYNQNAFSSFDKLIGSYDELTQKSFKTLLNYPDALLLLTGNIPLTSQLGRTYQDNTQDIEQQLAMKHDSLMVQHDREVAAYKKSIDADPHAGQELNQAAKTFAQNNGYILPSGYGAGMMYANPYSYWFGYPYWYGSPLWYPGAYWTGFGMSYGLGMVGLYGFPSYGFSNWFINRGYYAYPRLYRYARPYHSGVIAGSRYTPMARGYAGPSNRSNYQMSRPMYQNRSYPNVNSGARSGSYGGSFGGRSYSSGGGFRSGGFGGAGGHHR
nr:hypothetical protein [uncultured Arsenicibacter sp.]